MASPIHTIQRLRELRAFKPKDLSIGGVVASIAEETERTHKKLGELIALWEELVPADVAAHTSITGFRKGVLHVLVDSSSAGFQLDRLLRGGLTEQLRARFRATLLNVKTRIGQFGQA